MERVRWWLLLIAYAALIFHFAGQEAPPTPPLFPHQDKLMHFSEYVPFGYLALKAFAPVTPTGYIASVSFSLAYAASDELHQGIVATRDASFFDWLADAAGILIALRSGKTYKMPFFPPRWRAVSNRNSICACSAPSSKDAAIHNY